MIKQKVLTSDNNNLSMRREGRREGGRKGGENCGGVSHLLDYNHMYNKVI